MVRVCFVCLGNICRSPTAEGVMRFLVERAGLSKKIEVDSAGTAAYHAGELPDARSRQAAKARGIDVRGTARKFQRKDWQRFDYILALDQSNHDDLRDSAPSTAPLSKLHLLRSFDPASPRGASVPDPYYGGDDGFEDVIDMCEAACSGLLEVIRKEHGM